MTILRIIRKYAVEFKPASQETIDNIQGSIAGPSIEPKGLQSEDSGKGIPTRSAKTTSYLSQPYSPFETLIPGIDVDSPHLQNALQDAKTMLERIAQGHKIDNMMKTLGDIIRHSITAPKDQGKNIAQLVQAKLHYDGYETSDSDTTKHHRDSHLGMDKPCPSADCKHANLFSMYFSSVGRYLDKALTRPGWATSKSGHKFCQSKLDLNREYNCPICLPSRARLRLGTTF